MDVKRVKEGLKILETKNPKTMRPPMTMTMRRPLRDDENPPDPEPLEATPPSLFPSSLNSELILVSLAPNPFELDSR